ncbi:MAG TPA: DUF2382 domain-containing protein [Candidatus Nitrosocosmicus sp.]|nr:DUF2382 domain-containing protein [Candidatus Nitrosocosmicus sp.]
MRVSNNKDNINWKNVIKKDVIGTDGLDLGEVVEVGDNFFVTQKGLFNKKRFVIPNSTAESFDGDILRVKVNENELAGYEETADPSFKDYSKFKSSDMSKEMETTIPVIGENLQVSKKVVEDKVDIIKEPVKETKTVEIDLTYEKITIERIPINTEETGIQISPEQNKGLEGPDIEKPVSSQTQSLPEQNKGLEGPDIEKPVSIRTQISIPLKREVPVIIKNPYVREEVVIRKKPVKQTKVITSDVTHEEVTFEDKSNDNQT